MYSSYRRPILLLSRRGAATRRPRLWLCLAGYNNADANAEPHPHSYRYSHSDAYSHSDTHDYSGGHADLDANSHPRAQPHADFHTGGDSDGDEYHDAYCHDRAISDSDSYARRNS